MQKNIIDLQKFAKKDSLRPEISGVYFTGHKAIATDTYRLIEVESRKDTDKPANGIYNLSKIKVSGDFAITDNILIAGSSETKLLPEYGEFPDYAKIIPTTTPILTINFNAKLLREVLQFMEKTDKFGIVNFSFWANNKPVMITTENTDQKIMSLVMPVQK